MTINKDENEWFDKLEGGLRGFKRNKPVKDKQVNRSSESSFKHKSELIDAMRIAKRFQQALVKVAGFAHGTEQVSAHLNYISRNGELALENEQGEQITGLDEQEDEINSWESNFDDKGNGRDTAHVIMSLPPKTDRNKTLLAARNLLKQEFAEKDYHYVFTAHNDTEHPHVHACIKMRGEQGKKLTFKKAELHHLRRQFAQACREQGIEVEASFRYERGLIGKSMKSSIAQLRKQNKAPKADVKLLNKVRGNHKQQQHQASMETDDKDSLNTHNNEKSLTNSWQDRALRQRQFIQQRFKERAKELYIKSQKADELAMKEVLLQSAQETYDFANQLPHIDTRYDELQLALEVVEGGNDKAAILNQKDQQKMSQALKESLEQATVTLQSNGEWQDVLPPVCEQLLAHEATSTVLNDLAKHVRQPPLFIDSDKHSAVIAIGHEQYARLTLAEGQEKREQKPAIEPIHQNQVDEVKCEIFSAAKIDNAKLLASLTTHGNKEEQALDKAIDQDLQTTASKQQESVKERELALGQELEIDWDD